MCGQNYINPIHFLLVFGINHQHVLSYNPENLHTDVRSLHRTEVFKLHKIRKTSHISDSFLSADTVHMVRNTLKHVYYKDMKPFVTDLKTTYYAQSEKTVRTGLDKVSEKWGQKYPYTMKR